MKKQTPGSVSTPDGSGAQSPAIALTFDDGPNTTVTPAILNLLEEHNVAATFFLIGKNIHGETARIVERMVRMKCETANHSLTHSNMKEMKAEEIRREISETSRRIREITGEEPRFFRPPYIGISGTVFETAGLPLICGAVIGDWKKELTAEQRRAAVLDNAEDGAIILLHDSEGNTATVEALREALPELLARGFRLVTLSRLFEEKGVTPETGAHIIYNRVPELL